jgi:hypothetical protein
MNGGNWHGRVAATARPGLLRPKQEAISRYPIARGAAAR